MDIIRSDIVVLCFFLYYTLLVTRWSAFFDGTTFPYFHGFLNDAQLTNYLISLIE